MIMLKMWTCRVVCAWVIMYVPRENKNRTAAPSAAARDNLNFRVCVYSAASRSGLGSSALICSTNPGDRLTELGPLTCRDPFKMHPALESEMLHRIDYVLHPFLGVDIAVDVVAAAVGGGRVVAVACQSLKCHSVALCVTRPSGLVRRVVGRGK
jgi:hypothetical protein